MAVVDRVVLEHDRDLQAERDAVLFHRRGTVPRLVERIVAERVLEVLSALAFRACADELSERLHLSVRIAGILFRVLSLRFAGHFRLRVGRGRIAVAPRAVSVLHLFRDLGAVALVAVLIDRLHDLPALALLRIVRRVGVLRRIFVRRGLDFRVVVRLLRDRMFVAVAVRFRPVRRDRIVIGRTGRVLGLFILEDRDADRKADLIAVQDDGGVIAEAEIHRRQLDAEILLEFAVIAAEVGARAVRRAGRFAVLRIHHAVCARDRTNGSDRDEFRLDLVKCRDAGLRGGSEQRLLLFLDADGERRSADERAEVIVQYRFPCRR